MSPVSACAGRRYPGNWLLKPNEYHWLIPNYLADRAGIALSAGKPIILEARCPALATLDRVCM